MVFDEKGGILRVLGSLGVRSGTREAKRSVSAESGVHFGGHFGIFRVFSGVGFFMFFLVSQFVALWLHLGPKGGQKGGFGRSF